jgi:hypothetical protein
VAASSVLGAVIAQINASAGVLALLPQGAYAGETPQENVVPPSCVLKDTQDDPLWLTPAWRQESHRVTALCYAATGATVGAKNPADALADMVEGAVDWTLLNLPGTLTIGVPRKLRNFAKEVKLSPAGQRVWVVELTWRVVVSVG